TLDQTHPGFQRQLRDWYDEGSTNVHQALVKKSLTSSGYLNAQTRDLPITHPTVRSALAKYQADQGMVVTGELNFATYERALRHYVTLGEDGQFISVG
ncbi:MAG: peptidoglycan-binding protein, partial [Gammaproteobacteria bacterium]